MHHAIELSSFPGHTPGDTIKSVAEHSSMLQPSISCMPQLQPVCTVPMVVLPQRNEGLGKSCACSDPSPIEYWHPLCT